MILDAHVHFWDPSRGYDILILGREPSLARTYAPADLQPLLAKTGIDRVVAMQCAPSVDETREQLALCDRIPWVAGVVGWVDLASPAMSDVLAELRGVSPKLVGIRSMLHRIPDAGWIMSEPAVAGLRALASARLSIDLIANSHHLTSCTAALERVPELRAIVNHGATPPILGDGWEPWASRLSNLARRTTAVCKLSGLAEEASADWSADTLARYVGHLLECFGPQRLMFASNWPCIDLRGGYLRWWDALQGLLDRFGLDAEEREAILSGTARKAYIMGEAAP
jgi:L-fuconolactonase